MIFDVTDKIACANAAEKVKLMLAESSANQDDPSERNSRGIYALVNNAGIMDGNMIDMTLPETTDRVMQVNFMGIVNMVDAFLPLLKTEACKSALPHGARIVNMTSMAGRTVCRAMSAYCASKHAVEAYSDILRNEMRYWNIKVSIIEPCK